MKNMKKVFQIYKEGRTEKWVTILMDIFNPFDIDKKKATYLSLGYKVKSI